MTTVFATPIVPSISGHRENKFKNFNELGAYLLDKQALPSKRLEQKLRLEPAVRRGLVAAAITWGARAAFIDQSELVPLLVATARNGKLFAVAVTGDPRTWLRAAAVLSRSPEANDAGLLRYLSASEKIRSQRFLSQPGHLSQTETRRHVIEHTRLAA